MEEPSDNYARQTAEAFIHSVHTFKAPFSEGRALVDSFVERFYPVLRHYRPQVVGRCLAVIYDQSESHLSELHGFGLHMGAGNHRQDRESGQGSFRDDGIYLATVAHDYFRGALRP